jgi:hypothetical protein
MDSDFFLDPNLMRDNLTGQRLNVRRCWLILGAPCTTTQRSARFSADRRRELGRSRSNGLLGKSLPCRPTFSDQLASDLPCGELLEENGPAYENRTRT